MEIAAETLPRAGQTNGAEPRRANAASALSSDFETFLLMLTTQMENQDPLNPIESQDFAVQLATFSGVEQQVRTNTLLENLLGGLGMSGMAQLAGWIGMEARVAAPASFDGTPLTLVPSPEPGSDAAQLVVLDASGREVQRLAVPPGAETLEWAGVDAGGAPLPTGTYRFELHSINQGEVTGIGPVPHYARIVEARQGADGIEVVLDGGVVVASEEVTALRSPDFAAARHLEARGL